MRSTIFSVTLLAVGFLGFYALISDSLASTRHTRTLTFEERFAPALTLPGMNGATQNWPDSATLP
ncbi:hypothetical protein [Bradyrhizobium sp.]|uniref:hypothetical protein n=1 Tax=Bradyrhizobium sp. TaxID=376 RepID=UPI002D67F21B|nr:hypothetical protein [Bradyrhizobium sp.]HZR72085.1 hypothetical protein [Bradyrhizobium sp.]